MREEYEKGWSIDIAFPINGVGMTTARDRIVIDFEIKPIIERARTFRDSPLSDEEVCAQLGIPLKEGWNVSLARKLIRQVKDLSSEIKPVLYRPFDKRFIFYHDSLVWRTVKQIMKHMLSKENLGLIATRQTRDNWGVLATETIMGHKSFAAYDINSLFPLYQYTVPEETAGTLFAQTETTRKANLAPAFISAFSEKLGLSFVEGQTSEVSETSEVLRLGAKAKTFTPEDVFYYAYAVFHNPTYRTRYAEFLKIDFPRLPLTSDKKLFAKLVEKGKELVELHLLKSPKVEDFITAFPVSGDNKVEKVNYAKNRVYINPSQYFDGVPENVWEFQVGGYQVCEKWLKDRKERVLSGEDINHYQRVVVSLKETIRLMKEIDKAVVKWPME